MTFRYKQYTSDHIICHIRNLFFFMFRYDYSDYCTDVTKFPNPRFASEFGFQSYSSFRSMSNVSTAPVSTTVISSLPQSQVPSTTFLSKKNQNGWD